MNRFINYGTALLVGAVYHLFLQYIYDAPRWAASASGTIVFLLVLASMEAEDRHAELIQTPEAPTPKR